MKTINVITLMAVGFITAVVIPNAAAQTNPFAGFVVLAELHSVGDMDTAYDARFPGRFAMVHNPNVRIADVYLGPTDLVGQEFPLVPHGVAPRAADELTTLGYWEGRMAKAEFQPGLRMVLFVVRAKDYGPPPDNPDHPIYHQHSLTNFLHVPYRSVFYRLYQGMVFERPDTERFEMMKEWGEAMRSFSKIEASQQRTTILKEQVRSRNPLVAVTAVHLFKRLYPDEALTFFDQNVLEPGIDFHARLAIDQELCLERGQQWLQSKRLQLTPLLEQEAQEVREGKNLLKFREDMIRGRSWLRGGR
jgi:hypothetical protein